MKSNVGKFILEHLEEHGEKMVNGPNLVSIVEPHITEILTLPCQE
jgi:hypothetical protein